MKRLIETIRNIFKIEDLKKRLIYTFLLLLVYRLGSFIVMPGINPKLIAGSDLQAQTSGGLMGLLDMFSGGAFGNASIFALGVMPYISASIVLQLLGIMIPYFQKLQKEGESGRRKMNQWTRYLTIVILLLQGPAYLTNLRYQLPQEAFLLSGFTFNVFATLVLIGGTMFIMWLGERITDRGIGNGISMIIMIGIVARLPQAFLTEFNTRIHSSSGILMLLVEMIFLFLVFAATIALVQGTRKIPVQYTKRVYGNRQYGGNTSFIPLKINAANVMPIIFAQALMMFPLLFAQFDATRGIAGTFSNIQGFWYNFVFAFLIIIFTYFYTTVIINPTAMADEMKKSGGFIPGVQPGRKTADFIDTVMSRITLPGSIFLALVGIMPALAMICGVTNQFAQFYGGTSLLIVVGVVLDTLQQIETYLINRHYEGISSTGRLVGRR